ncbi:MAG TPA: DUF983 domain-containing protein [Candidatus Binatia bacterium]|jgi:uncharacterized protein (DUF983 family)
MNRQSRPSHKLALTLFKILRSGIRLRCPRCGVGRLYAKPFKMFDYCPECNLKFEREQGYFIGAIYINYAATVAIAVPGYLILDALTGMTIGWQLALWVPFAVIFPLVFFHHARSLWLAFDHFFNPAASLYGVPPKKTTDH